MKINKSKNAMPIKWQDILLSMGYNPKQFRYVKNSPDNVMFQCISNGKNINIRY